MTDYVREGMNRAERLREGGDRKRGIIVGFALTGLQRRRGSSPEAIYRSLVRRRNRLERRRVELERLGDRLAEAGLALGELPSGFSIADLEDFDADAFTDRELEALEDFVIDEATAAATVAELTVEIGQLGTLEKLAEEVRRSGQDRKWEELRSILLGPELQGLEGSKKKLIVFTEHRDTLQYLVGRVTTLLGKPEAVVLCAGDERDVAGEGEGGDRDRCGSSGADDVEAARASLRAAGYCRGGVPALRQGLIRSRIWDPEVQIDRSVYPTYGQVLADQIAGADAKEIDDSEEEANRNRLY